MSTRSLTRIYDEENKCITTIYKQSDGYPEGYGLDLAKFLERINCVNGLGLGKNHKVANGPECLAAQIIAHFKTGPGGVYIYHPSAVNCGEEYVYKVFCKTGQEPSMEVYEVYKRIIKIFHGTPTEFIQKYKAEI